MRTPLGRPSTRRPDRSRPRPSPSPQKPRGPWKAGAVPVIGLVGGIGAGKSRVAAMMAEKGAHVLDADAIGHVLLDQPPTRDEVIEKFTEQVIDTSQSGGPPVIDRKKLGAIVFADVTSRKVLEAILHPRMRQTFEKAISRTARKKLESAVILDAAVLFEARWNELCDVVVFVDAPLEVRQARVQASRGWTPETHADREAAQMSLDQKRSKCDFVLANTGDEATLTAAVAALWEKLTRRPKVDPSVHRFRRPTRPDPAV